jgi:hypothetical protein
MAVHGCPAIYNKCKYDGATELTQWIDSIRTSLCDLSPICNIEVYCTVLNDLTFSQYLSLVCHYYNNMKKFTV